MNILNEIALRTKERIEERKKVLPLERLVKTIDDITTSHSLREGTRPSPTTPFSFEQALKSKDIAFICEVKKASPSKGVIAEDFPYLQIAMDYEKAGAAAISVLTEPYYFKGSDQYLREIAGKVSIPTLRKDFTVDEYMIYEAKALESSAVLLICAILQKDTIARYIKIADELGLSALVETHSEQEVTTAIDAGARIIGVNNRNLKTFDVDITLSERLRKFVPPEIIFVSESGIKTPEDIDDLRKAQVNAVLIGETIMRSDDKKAETARLRGED